MKIQIKQSKLLDILDYLYVDGLFPFSIVTVKDGKLYSAQMAKEGLAFRYAMFTSDYFKYISTEQESIKIDIEKVKKFISLRRPDSIITLEFDTKNTENKLVISGDRAKDNITLTKIDDEEIKSGLPFKIKDGVPYLHKGQVPLDTHIVVSLKSFKDINDYGTAHGTKFFNFRIDKDRKLKIRIGDIHALSDFTIYEPNCKVLNVGEDLNVTFTKGLPELTKTFSSDIDIHLRSNMPGWFTESSQNHKFGVLLSPVREE